MRTPLLILVAAVLVAGALWFVLADDGTRRDGPVQTLPGLGSAGARDGAAPAPLRKDSEVQSLVPDAPAPPPEDSGPPASYRAALGGITGRVVEEGGEPVPDMPVALVGVDFFDVMTPLDRAAEAGDAFDPVLAEVVTGEDGRFTARELEPRVIGGVLVDPGGPRALVRLLDQTPSTGELRDIGDIVLPGGVTLRGTVLDERREPLAGVRVRCLPINPPIFPEEIVELRADGGVMVDAEGAGTFTFRPSRSLGRLERLLPLPTTRTAADGSWELDGVPAGTPLMLFDDGAHVGRALRPGPTGPPGGVLEVGETILYDGVTLTGRVVDERGEPVPGAEVLVGNRLSLGPVAILRAPLTADGQGRFSASGLRPAQAHAVARRAEHEDYVASDAVRAGEEPAVVTLAGGRRLTLTLLDPNGAPLTGAKVSGRSLPDDDADEAPDFLFPTRSLAALSSVDEEQRTVVDELSASYWDLSIQREGYALHREVFDLRKADLAVELRLVPERTVRVRVLAAATGEPVEHARVAAINGTSRGFDDRPLTSERTDVEGFAELGGLAEGDAVVTVDHPAFAAVDQRFEVPREELLVVELPRGGTIRGQVFEQGQAPVEPVMITLTTEGEVDVAQAPRFTVTDLEGAFTFTNVQPGEARLEARERVASINFASPFDTFFVSELASTEVQVEADREVEAVLLLGTGAEGVETARLSGSLRVNGVPVEGWHLRTWGRLRRSAATAPDGSFDLGLVAAGDVQVMVSPPGRSMMNGGVTHSERVELSPGDERWIDIAFDTSGLSGRILDAVNGQPLRGAAVSAQNTEGSNNWFSRGMGTTVSDQAGFFEIDHLAVGSYAVHADVQGYTKAVSDPVELAPGRRPRVELRMTRGWEIAGELVLQGVDTSEPPRWMWLMASTEDGREAAARPSEDLQFRFDDLGPGTWEFRLMSSHSEEFAPVQVQLDYERDDLSLVFAPVPPPPPPEEAAKEQLEALGYIGEDG